MGLIGLEKACDRVNRETLWQMLRMYGVGGKLLGGIKSMYEDSLACLGVKRGMSERFRADSGVRQGCIMFPWLFNVYIDAKMKEVKIGVGRRGVRFMEKGREWRLSVLFYAGDLVMCDESEKDLRAMVRLFVEVCRRRVLKVNADEDRLEHVSELKYFGCVLDEAGTDGAECSRKVASGKRVAGVIRSLVNARDLKIG